MEKTLKIDGKNITFKATGGTLYRYKNQFNREFLTDAADLMDFGNSKKQKKVKQPDGKITFEDEYDFTKLNLELVYNLAWVMAKTADPSIPDPLAWLDSFDSFPVVDIVQPIMELLQNSFTTTKNV
jgi:hypothetical protein